MNYFTHEWYHDTLVSQMCFSLRKSAKAAIYSDKFFDKLYQSEKKWYVKFCKRAAKFAKEPFDVIATEKAFDDNYKDNLEFVKTLPEEITSKIADMRIFALGTVEHSMADEITRYCGKVNRQCEKIKRDYLDHIDSMGEEIGWKKLDRLAWLDNAADISFTESSDGKVIISSQINCLEMTLENTTLPLSHKLLHATIIANEFYKNEEGKKFTIMLLCEDEEKELFDTALYFDDFVIVKKEE